MTGLGNSREQRDQSFGLRVGQGIEHYSLNNGKQRGVGSNSQGKCDNRDRRERRAFQEHPQAVADVLPQNMHRPTPKTLRCKPDLLQTDAIVVVPLRHVRKNDAVTDLQALQYLNGIDGSASKFHVDARCFGAVRAQLE
jgi:hypothetical protein